MKKSELVIRWIIAAASGIAAFGLSALRWVYGRKVRISDVLTT
jgi:hypothetical protein